MFRRRSRQSAGRHGHVFSPRYNTEHHHSGLGLLTPHDVHFGSAEQRVAERAVVIATAYVIHPERFPADRPMPAASRLLYPLLGSTRVSPAPLLRLDALRAVSAGPLLPKGI